MTSRVAVLLRHERRQPRTRARCLLAGLVATTALTSCHSPAHMFSGGPAVGPMRQGDGWGTFCGPKHGESDFVLGLDDLSDTGDHHLVLDSAGLAGASNLTETGAYVTLVGPGHGDGFFGVLPGIPPQFLGRSQASEWANRQPLSGTVVPSRSTPVVVNLLVVVHSPNPDAMSSVHHLVVHYHSGRQHYVYTGNLTYQLSPETQC